MGHSKTLGGDRLGGGKKNKVYMHGYERTTHDLSYVWKNTQSVGTLVPFMSEVALPGDTFDINIDSDVLTHPTIGPLFGSFKLHIDLFQIPIRLYQAALHMNMLNIGMDMSKVIMPVVKITGNNPDYTSNMDNQQINPSCIYKYLGISGIGKGNGASPVARYFNALPILMYWDIYKNYYANKQEKIGVVVHQEAQAVIPVLQAAKVMNGSPANINIPINATPWANQVYSMPAGSYVTLQFDKATLNPSLTLSQIRFTTTTNSTYATANTLFSTININLEEGIVTLTGPLFPTNALGKVDIQQPATINTIVSPRLVTFPLDNIDTVRLSILQKNPNSAYQLNEGATNLPPYNLLNVSGGIAPNVQYSIQYAQEGLGIRTYASDLFNNWVNTDTIDGANGITAVTSVNVVGGKFTIDELNLNKKVYEMLNRIAVSGGTYADWVTAVWDEDGTWNAENPMYIGGQLKNIVFQEVVSNAATAEEPLGTLAGRGKIGGLDKGGKIIAKVKEPSYIMGIVSIVPNIDYSQGNKWDVNLKTLNDLHKPALDEIGFQNLITEQMAWWETVVTNPDTVVQRSAGKQPAWINYMTNVSKAYGNFAIESEQMFMTLNRKYDVKLQGTDPRIADLTTYIDPVKYNYVFADTRLDAMNIWVQIAVNMEVRRKMSGKVIPNL